MRETVEKVDAYRPDIDGLRAVAVLSVVVFHTFPAYFPGGFVGVDIFFVISGFLISGIIFKSLDRGTFSFAEFYQRRIRRIFPALVLVLFACLAFGWIALLPTEYAHLAKHTLSGAGFLSNVKLWRESGYFDISSAHKPLLHLWSLGIEEQFYLIWPTCLLLFWKQKKSMLWAIAGVAASSLLVSVFTVRAHHDFAFYLPFSRFWELLLGAILAYLNMFRSSAYSTLPKNLCATVGSLLIISALMFVNESRAFPGWWALLPTIGSALLIAAGPEAWVNRVVLRFPAMVLIGLISYPLYLWHWPILSFARLVGSPTPGLLVGLVLCSFLLAWITWKVVETPIRTRRTREKESVLMLAAGMGFVCAISCVLVLTQGVPERLPHGSTNVLMDVSDFAMPESNGPFLLRNLRYNAQSKSGNIDAALVGDSHALALFPGVSFIDRERTWLVIGSDACPPTLGITVKSPWSPNCAENMKQAFEWLTRPDKPQIVVLAFSGGYKEATDPEAGLRTRLVGRTPRESDFDVLFRGLGNSIQMLLSAGKDVYLVVDVPRLPFFPSDCVRRSIFFNSDPCFIEPSVFNQKQETLRSVIHRLQDRFPSLRVFDPLPLFCKHDQCRPVSNDFSFYRDNEHLSIRGSNAVASALVGLINRTNQIRNKAPHLATRVQDSRLNRPYTAPQSPTLAGLQTPAFELAPHLAQGQPSSSAEAVHTVRIRRPMQQP